MSEKRFQSAEEEIMIETGMVYFFHCLGCGEKNEVENEEAANVSCGECGTRYQVKDEDDYFMKTEEDEERESGGEKLKDVV